MKKYFLLILIIVATCASIEVSAQDIITTKTGEEIKARLLKLTRKQATYKTYDDPEFSTYTLPYKELASIKKEGQRKAVLFNHHLPRGYICYSMAPPGSAIPLGSFGSSSFSSKHEPGFVDHNKGFNAKFDIAFYIYKKLGLSIGLGYSNTPFDYSAYAYALNGGNSVNNTQGGNFNVNALTTNEYNDGQYVRNSGNNSGNGTNYNYKVRTRYDNWVFVQALMGPIYSVKLGRRITWDFKARGGVIQINRPNIAVTYQPPSGSNTPYTTYEYHQTQKTNFGYNFGTSLRLALSKRLALYGSADYVHTEPQISFDVTSEQSLNNSTVNTSGPQTSTVQYKISSLNLSLGFAYQFKRKGNKYE
jgi:hypothetical protein